MKYSVFCLILITGFTSGCGLFMPNEPEKPGENTPGLTDPFRFNQIVSNTHIHFSDLEYTELFFDSDSLYLSNNNRPFKKDRFLDHLSSIYTEFDSIRIEWEPDSTRDSIIFQPRDTISINPAYMVWAYVGDDYDYFEAKTTFRLIFIQNKWVIFTFKDGFSEHSIFHPEYKRN